MAKKKDTQSSQGPKAPPSSRGFYKAIKARHHHFSSSEVATLLAQIDQQRVTELGTSISTYIGKNLPEAIEKREGLAAYRTNPYVLLTSATVMRLTDPAAFASFLFNTKLYMGLETSFGKSIESVLVVPYPCGAPAIARWKEPPEKVAESQALANLDREEKAQARIDSVWREIDKSCVIGNRRFLVSIKSGPSCINDTQVKGMTDAIAKEYPKWLTNTRQNCKGVTELDIVIGLTYGTDRTTNNKENQILVKLLQKDFEEEDRVNKPGVLIDSKTRSVRVSRRIGIDFWSFIGNPSNPDLARFTYLEVLLALLKALSVGAASASLEDRVNLKVRQLALAINQLGFPRNSLPEWVRADFKEHELCWLAAAMSAFYDEGV